MKDAFIQSGRLAHDNDNSRFSIEELEEIRRISFPYIREETITNVCFHAANPKIIMALKERQHHRSIFWVTRTNTDRQFPVYELDFPGTAKLWNIEGLDRLCRILKKRLSEEYPLPKPPIFLVSELT